MDIYRLNPVAVGAGIALMIGAPLLGLAACSSDEEPQQGDNIENVEQRDLNKAEQYTNVEGYAHLVRGCIDGVAFAFTGSESAPVLRIPEWDELYCGSGPGVTYPQPPLPQPTETP